MQALVALNETMQGDDDLPQPNNAYLFDINHLVTEMGIDMWNFSSWRLSKAIAEVLLLWLRNVNSMALVTSSMALFSMFDDKRLLQSRQFYMAVSGSKRKAKSFKDDEERELTVNYFRTTQLEQNNQMAINMVIEKWHNSRYGKRPAKESRSRKKKANPFYRRKKKA
nr:Nucleoporin like [Ipomoea batatas]